MRREEEGGEMRDVQEKVPASAVLPTDKQTVAPAASVEFSVCFSSSSFPIFLICSFVEEVIDQGWVSRATPVPMARFEGGCSEISHNF